MQLTPPGSVSVPELPASLGIAEASPVDSLAAGVTQEGRVRGHGIFSHLSDAIKRHNYQQKNGMAVITKGAPGNRHQGGRQP